MLECELVKNVTPISIKGSNMNIGDLAIVTSDNGHKDEILFKIDNSKIILLKDPNVWWHSNTTVEVRILKSGEQILLTVK